MYIRVFTQILKLSISIGGFWGNINGSQITIYGQLKLYDYPILSWLFEKDYKQYRHPKDLISTNPF